MDDVKEKKSTGGNTSSKDKTSSRTERYNWGVMSVKEKLTDKCLWSACKAMTAGFLFIIVGAGMATLGFYSEHLSKFEETKGNQTVWVKNERKDSHLASLTYLGPVVMGIGGFTIVAACVMAFEARDTAAKIVPIWFRRTRIHVASGGSGSTPSERSSKASWERFLSQQKSSEDSADTRSAVTQALVNFSKYLQSSVDTNKLPQTNVQVSNQQPSNLRKCPSEPNIGKILRDANGNNIPESVALLEASTPQPSQRPAYGGGLQNTTRPMKPQLLSVAPDIYRQTVSMDCPRISRLNDEKENAAQSDKRGEVNGKLESIKIQTLSLQTSCATSSSGSMSVDIYLPQGAVTLKIHDDMKETKKYFAEIEDSQEIRGYELQSFGDEDDFCPVYVEDTNQDPSFSAPQIILNNLEVEKSNPQHDTDNRLIHKSLVKRNSIEEWSNYPSALVNVEQKSESLDVELTSGSSPQSLSISTQFSFEGVDKESGGTSSASVISNTVSSPIYDQRSFSLNDSSFFNVSSLGSIGSFHDIVSPSLFPDNPFSFEYSRETSSNPPKSSDKHAKILMARTHKMEKKNLSLPESGPDHQKIQDSNSKSNPQKHLSLESAEIQLSRSKQNAIPKNQKFSFEETENLIQDPFLPLSSRFLSPGAVSGRTSPNPHSPRKKRSESLPERRQAPSIKRFPLLRQVALDAFAEEGGSSHRLDRSMTQISPKETFFPD